MPGMSLASVTRTGRARATEPAGFAALPGLAHIGVALVAAGPHESADQGGSS
jgi:hypothetical protein